MAALKNRANANEPDDDTQSEEAAPEGPKASNWDMIQVILTTVFLVAAIALVLREKSLHYPG